MKYINIIFAITDVVKDKFSKRSETRRLLLVDQSEYKEGVAEIEIFTVAVCKGDFTLLEALGIIDREK